MANGPPKRRINAAENTFAIIDYIREHGNTTLPELAAELDLTKSTVHTYLATMLDLGYLRQNDNTYSLSLKFLDLGEAVRRDTGIITIVREGLRDIVEQTDDIAWFIVEEAGEAVFVEKALGENAVQPYGSVGKRTTLHDIAGGKAILAHLPEDRVREILDEQGLTKRTEKTIDDREDFFDNLQQIREQGYATNDGENVEGWRAISSPILYEDEVVGAIATSGPAHRLRAERFNEQIPEIVMATANEIQLQMLSR
ncbi:IclR family transcriptional regulator [Haloarcula amylovorans]|uniref:IclR family transcriptional regulator n=1 Tax=Haloarcula amylovorans TaxID=2562280 RepID=UPI0010769665|nr:IclR family transcriptional regulator [Halomicroarcula amylolytica]